MSVPVVFVSFVIAMAVTLVTLFFPIGVAVSMFFLPFPISAMAVATTAVPMMAVTGGMTRRRHGHRQQDEGGKDIQRGDVEKCGFDTIQGK